MTAKNNISLDAAFKTALQTELQIVKTSDLQDPTTLIQSVITPMLTGLGGITGASSSAIVNGKLVIVSTDGNNTYTFNPTTTTGLGVELVVNGNFAAGITGWPSFWGGNVTAGEAVFNVNTTYAPMLAQTISTLTVGKTYRVSFDVMNYVSGEVRFCIGDQSGNNCNYSNTYRANGHYSFDLLFDKATAPKDIRVLNWSIVPAVYHIDNVSVKEII